MGFFNIISKLFFFFYFSFQEPFQANIERIKDMVRLVLFLCVSCLVVLLLFPLYEFKWKYWWVWCSASHDSHFTAFLFREENRRRCPKRPTTPSTLLEPPTL